MRSLTAVGASVVWIATAFACAPHVDDAAAAAAGGVTSGADAAGTQTASGSGSGSGVGGAATTTVTSTTTSTSATSSGVGGGSATSSGVGGSGVTTSGVGGGAMSSSAVTTSASASSTTSSAVGVGGAGGGGGCSPTGQPELLATATGEVRRIAVDDDYAYWADPLDGSVSRVSLCTHAVTVLVTGQLSPTPIAVDGESVFWGAAGNEGGVWSAPRAGGTATKLWQGGQVESLLIDGGRIYFTAWPGSQTHKVGVWAIDMDGGNPLELYSRRTLPPVGTDATRVYFSPSGSSQTLLAVPKTGGPPTLVGQLGVDGKLVTAGGVVYAATWQEGLQDANVVAFPGAGATPIVFAASSTDATAGIAVTATSVVWSNLTQGTILAAPLAGGAVTTLAGGLGEPWDVVSRGEAIFWTTYGDGGIWRMKAP